MYVTGGTKAICDRCGFEYPLKSLRKEWTGLMVCAKDLDPKPPQMSPPKVRPEGLPLPNARPDNQTEADEFAWLDALAAEGGQPAAMAVDPTFTAGIAGAGPTLAGTTYLWNNASAFQLLGGNWEVTGAVYPGDGYGSCRNVTFSADRSSYTVAGGGFEFDHTGDALEVFLPGNGSTIRLLVNGETTTTSFPATPVDGALYWHKVTFATVATRRLRFEARRYGMVFGGCRIKTGQTVAAATHTRRLVIPGDSFTEGTGATDFGGSGLAPYVARELGFSDYNYSGSGGTGWNPNASERICLSSRWGFDVINQAPDMVVCLMGLNDGANIESVVDMRLAQLRKALPDCLIHVFGPFDIAAPSAMVTSSVLRNNEIERATAWVSNCWFHSLEGVSFTKADGTHPNQAGHVTLGKAIYNKIAAVHGLHTVV